MYYCIVEKITTTPRKINCSVRIHRCVPQLGLLKVVWNPVAKPTRWWQMTIIHIETIINFKNKFTVTIKFGLCVLEDLL